MPQRVDVPGMGIVEFPDGMSDVEMAAAIRRSMPAQQQVQPGPEEGAGRAALIAAGRGTDKVVQGVRQAYNWMTGDQGALDKMAATEGENDRLYAPLKEKHPIATGIGEMAPGVAAGAMTGGGSYLAAAASQAIPALLSYGSAEDRLKHAAIEGAMGAAGAGAGKLAAKLIQPTSKAGAPLVGSDALAAAERLGFKPSAAQITQNPGLQGLENYLARSQGSAATMQALQEARQAALNRGAARAMGETSGTLDAGAFGAAQRRIGGEFDRLSAATKPQLGNDFVDVLAKIEAGNAAKGPFASKEVSGLIDKGLELAAKGNLEGAAYREIRSELANGAQAAFKSGDATTGQAYKALRDALDEAAKSSLTKADQKAWDAARKEWSAFRMLTKGAVAEGGNVSPARVASELRRQGPGFRAGNTSGELTDIARLGESFKGISNPNSGTLLNSNPLTLGSAPIALGNRLFAGAYNTPAAQRYLTEGLFNLDPVARRLLEQVGTQGGVASGRALLGAE